MDERLNPLIATALPVDSRLALADVHGLYVLGRAGRGEFNDGKLDFGAEAVYRDEREDGARDWELDFDGERDSATQVLVPTAVTIRPAAPDRSAPIALDSVLLRKLPIRLAYSDAISRRVGWALPVDSDSVPEIVGSFELPPRALDDELPRSGISDDMLALVSRIYYVARLIGRPPMQAVQQTFGVGRAKANFWLNRAREVGLIGESATHRPDEREYREPDPVSAEFASWLLEAAVADLVDKGANEATARRLVGVGVPTASAAAPAPAADDGAAAAADSDGVAQALAQAGVSSPDSQAKVLAEFNRRGVSRAEVAAMPFHVLDGRLGPVLESLGLLDG